LKELTARGAYKNSISLSF